MSFGRRLLDEKSRSLNPEHLLQTIRAFAQADSQSEFQRILEQHPELLTDGADDLLGRMIAAQDDANVIAYLEQHCILLRRYRVVGVEQAFAERSGGLVQPRTVPIRFA